eukprot:Em0069g13a
MQTFGNKDSRRASCSLFSNWKGDICTSPRLACCHLLQDQPYSQTAHSCLQEQDSYLRPRRLYVQCQHEKKNRLYMHMYKYIQICYRRCLRQNSPSSIVSLILGRCN